MSKESIVGGAATAPPRRRNGWRFRAIELFLCLSPLTVGCRPDRSAEADVARELVPGLELGKPFDPDKLGLSEVQFIAKVGYSGKVGAPTSAIELISVDARVSEEPPASQPVVLGAFLLSRPKGGRSLARAAEAAALRAYGHPPIVGCSSSGGDSRSVVMHWGSRLGGVWIFMPNDTMRSGVEVFIRGPAITYPSMSPQFDAGPCAGS